MAGAVAEMAAECKDLKYQALEARCVLQALDCETLGSINTEAARQFLAHLVRTISHHSADEHIINVSQFCFFVLIRFFLHDSFLN